MFSVCIFGVLQVCPKAKELIAHVQEHAAGPVLLISSLIRSSGRFFNIADSPMIEARSFVPNHCICVI